MPNTVDDSILTDLKAKIIKKQIDLRNQRNELFKLQTMLQGITKKVVSRTVDEKTKEITEVFGDIIDAGTGQVITEDRRFTVYQSILKRSTDLGIK